MIGQSDKAGGIRDNVLGYSAACLVKMPSRSGGAGVRALFAESMKLGRTLARLSLGTTARSLCSFSIEMIFVTKPLPRAIGDKAVS